MKQQFALFNNHVQSGTPFDGNAFKAKALIVLNDNPTDNDKFFNEFTPAWKMLSGGGRHIQAESLWIFAEQIAEEWERNNPGKVIHKGTPFYFWAITCLLMEKFSKTFVLMHRALKEDNRTYGATNMTAARAFVRLDHNYGAQFARPIVQTIAGFLDLLLKEYRKGRGKQLDLAGFQTKFLHQVQYEDDAFWFVYVLHVTENLYRTKIWGLGDTQFGQSYLARVASDLCLALENLLANKFTGKTLAPKINTYDNSLIDSNARTMNNTDLSNALEDVLRGTNHMGITFVSERQKDFSIVYLLRNHAAHEIQGHSLVQDEFEEIVKRIYFAIFDIVETAY